MKTSVLLLVIFLILWFCTTKHSVY